MILIKFIFQNITYIFPTFFYISVAPKAPSKFFKSKQQPQQQQPLTPQVVVSPKKAPPLRPLEVTPNQAVPPVKDTKEVIMKVPPLKLRFKTGIVNCKYKYVSQLAKYLKY